jgi:hypothetical protein
MTVAKNKKDERETQKKLKELVDGANGGINLMLECGFFMQRLCAHMHGPHTTTTLRPFSIIKLITTP